MRYRSLILVSVAVMMLIPGVYILTDSENSSADTSVAVTPTGSATAATLTYLSSGSYYTDTYAEHKYVNWKLDITVPRTYGYGATFDVSSTMGSMASSFGYTSSWFQVISVADSFENNSSITNAGIGIEYGMVSGSYRTVQVSGTSFNSTGDYNYQNSYASGYQSNKWVVMTSNGIDMQIRNFISIAVHVVPRTYTLTYYTNGGSFSSTPQTVFTEGTTVNLATNISRTDYTFTGWIDTTNQQVTQVTMNSDITVSATWDWNYRVLTYNTNGGTFSDTPTTIYLKGSTATLDNNITQAGYTFGGWLINSSPVTEVVMDTNKTVNASWNGNQYTVYFNANGGNVGTASKTVTYGSQYGELPVPTYTGYNFNGWYTDPTNGELISGGSTYLTVGNQTLYAHWTENITYWSNGNPNSSVSILYHIDNKNVTNDLITRYKLYRYDETIPDNPNTEVIESFVLTGYYLLVEVNSVKVGSTNDITVIVGLYDSNNILIASNIYDFGSWGSFIITVDTVNATVGYTKVMQFRTFTDYQESVSGTILSYGSYGNFSGQVTEVLEIIPVTATVPRQQVVKTSVFLNTYGVVLRNPSLDIGTYFPNMTNMRLNFYSFALYGDSITINGHTMNVTAPNLTVYYTSDANGNHIADSPGTGVNEKSVELTNIYITWDGSRCSLTFANDSLTIDMGTYTDKTVSFSGMWYFASALYEPYTAQETSYDVNWYSSFDLSTFGIVLAGLLILGAIVCKATIGGRALDYVIIICGTLVALVIAGGLINA